jgi:hypothetical protein
MCEPNEAQISRQILAYLLRHVEAQDTVEGIAEWWLLEQTINRHINYVKEAINDLATKKLLLTYRTSDSKIFYKLNCRRMKEIRAMLKKDDA